MRWPFQSITTGPGACPTITIHHFHKNTPGLDFHDPRGILYQGEQFLTTISHLRLAHSQDGLHFTVETAPALFPSEAYEEYGIEDPRMTLLDGRVYITYTAVSRHGVCVALASTTDFHHYTKHGLILPPENKDAVLFPERIQGTIHDDPPSDRRRPWRSPDVVGVFHGSPALG